MNDTYGCTCWQVTDADGATVPLAFACQHDQIRVVARDGRTATGWSVGASWYTDDFTVDSVLDVEDEDSGDDVFFVSSEIDTVTPVGQQATIESVADAVSRVATSTGDAEAYVRLIVDAHHSVDVEIRRVTHSCIPGPAPKWLTA